VGQPGLENSDPLLFAADPKASLAATSPKVAASTRYPVDADASGPAIGPVDPVEAALAHALAAAAAAGRFDVVAQLARELEARRLAREPHVIAFDARARRR